MSHIKSLLDRLIKLHTLSTQHTKQHSCVQKKKNNNYAAHGADGPSARLPAFDPSAAEA